MEPSADVGYRQLRFNLRQTPEGQCVTDEGQIQALERWEVVRERHSVGEPGIVIYAPTSSGTRREVIEIRGPLYEVIARALAEALDAAACHPCKLPEAPK